MKNKEFREIQVSSSALIFIFLAILVLGVFIFLQGVSVGKKHAQMTGSPTLLSQSTTETVTQQPPVVSPQGTADLPEVQVQEKKVEPSRSSPPVQEEERTVVPLAETQVTAKTGLDYIQVAAFLDKSQATRLAEDFKKKGYSVLVLDPLPADKKTVYRVRLGGYATREEAAQDLAKLNSASKKKTGYYITKD